MRKKFPILFAIFGAVLIFTIIGLSVHSSATDGTKQLKLVHVITRHGIRTPQSTYPNDPYINQTFFPYGWAQLTNAGKQQMYSSGLFLRNRYNTFLGPNFTPDLFYAQSTDTDRTRVSLELIDAGLWPPLGDDIWGPLPWQPIPVHAEPLNIDSLLLVRRPCPQYQIELRRVWENDEVVRKKVEESKELFEYLTEKTGMNVRNFDDVQDIYNTLMAEVSYNLTLPLWTEGYYPEKMYEPTVFSYILNSYNKKLNRLKGGMLLKKLLQDWKSVANATLDPKERKMFLYGGHDSTIVNILNTLQIWDPQFPTYGIMVLFEFSKDLITNTFGLEIFLRNSTDLGPTQLTIPGCNAFCPLNELIELTEEVIPENWEQECQTDDSNFEIFTQGGP